MPSMTRRSRVAVVAAAAVVLAGCSGGGDQKETDQPASQASASKAPSMPTSVDPAKVSPPDMPTVPQVKNATGAASDVTLGKCATTQGTQKVTGTVKSSAKDTVDYLVELDWINDTYDVRGRGYAVVKQIQPGQSKSFLIKAKVASGATQCVPNVQYGTIKGG